MSIWEAWVRIPSKAESFSVNFSPIGKIATHPLGSLFVFNPQVKINLFNYKFTSKSRSDEPSFSPIKW